MSDKIRSKLESGQSLVLVALMIVGFIGMLALVLDGGNVYLKRRQAQTAADAGALAGAWTYCTTDEDLYNPYDKAKEEAEIYVGNNQANFEEDDFNIESDAMEVTVGTSIDFNSFFLQVLGRPALRVEASASAVCTPPEYSLAPLPVAWYCQDPVEVVDKEETNPDEGENDNVCEVEIVDEGEYENPPDDVPLENIYVMMENLPDDSLCQVPPNYKDPESDPGEDGDDTNCDGDECVCKGDIDYSTTLDCDVDNDCLNDMGGNADSGWIDLNGGGGGVNELIKFINGTLQIKISYHTWVEDSGGDKTNVYKEVEQYVGEEVIVPIYNDRCKQGHPEKYCEDRIHYDIPDTILEEGQGGEWYHIISFAKFRITCVQYPPYKESCPGFDYLSTYVPDLYDFNTKYIEGYFTQGFEDDIGGITIDAPSTGTYVVYLTK